MTDFRTEQLSYVPTVEGEAIPAPVTVVGGMGGSGFPTRVARFLGASSYLISHQDYDLPERVPAGARYVAISYSGETEETLSFAKEALARDLPLSVVASGGTLLRLAQERGLPHVVVPKGPTPRDSIVTMSKALLALLRESHLMDAKDAGFDAAENEGKRLAAALKGRIPVFYASKRNEALALYAKILVNETAKVPAFANTFPELNHNEMQGYGAVEKSLTAPFAAVMLRDLSDSERIRTRTDLMESLLNEQGVRTASLSLPSSSRADAFAHGWWLLRNMTLALASAYGVDPEATPLIDSFKKGL